MKKFLIGLTVFVVLIVVAVLVAPSFVDWSKYRAEIAQKVEEATGRELIIGGDIKFSVLPSPVLKVGDIRLSNADGASSNNMVSIAQLDVRVSFLPLLGGNIHIQSLRLIEPVVVLEMLETGKGNWVLASAEETTKAETVDTPLQSGSPQFDEIQETTDAPLPVQVDDFIIERGRVIYLDRKAGIQETVEDLNSRFAIAGLNGPFEAAGTMTARGIPLGFEVNVGQMVNGRTASFGSILKLAHGESAAKISGTFVNLAEGPKLNAKLDVSGKSLAGLISAFNEAKTLPGALNRSFSLKGDVAYSPSGLSLGEHGLDLNLGEEHGRLMVEFSEGERKKLNVEANFSKLNGDLWLEGKPYKVVAPQPLELVIKPSKGAARQSGVNISAALDVGEPEQKQPELSEGQKALNLPKDIDANVVLNVDAVIVKGEPVRQLHAGVILDNGELALERVSAILPGAGEVSMIGVAGERDGKAQFDGTLEINVAHLRGALRWLGVAVPNVPTDRLQQVKLQSQISANQDNVRLYDLVAKMDGSTLQGATTVALRARPSFGTSFKLDRLNLDAYVGGAHAKAAQQSQDTASSSDQAKAVSNKTTSQKAVSPLDALKALQAFDANLNVEVGHLTYQQRDIKGVNFDGTIYNGGLTIRSAGVKNFAGVKVAAKGAVMPKENGVIADNFNVTVSGKNLSGAARVLGMEQALDWKAFGPLNLNATLNGNVLAPDIDVNANALGSSVIVAGAADFFPIPKADATLNVQSKDIRRVTRGLGLNYQPSGNPGALELNTDLSYTGNQASLKNISGRIGKAALSGEVLYTMGNRPFVDVALNTGALRLDPFMPKEQTATNSKTKSPSRKKSSTGSTKASASSSAKWSREPIDLSALRSMDAKVRVKSTAIAHKKLTAQNVTISADLNDGVLNVSDISAGMFGGTAKMLLNVDATQQPVISSSLKGAGFSVGSFLAQTGSTTKAGGALDFDAQLNTSGASEFDLVSNLSGPVAANLKRVSVGSKGKGSSPLDILNLLAVLSGTDPSKGLADVALKADVQKGVAQLTQGELVSNIASGRATGYVNLPDWYVDVSGSLNIQQNALIGLLAQKAKMKEDYPFAVKGALDKPDVKLDSGGIDSGGGLVIPLPKNIEKKGYGNLIRGLLGGGGANVEQQQQPQAPTQNTDGTIAPPPPPGGGSGGSNTSQQRQPSTEELIFQGLGQLLKK